MKPNTYTEVKAWENKHVLSLLLKLDSVETDMNSKNKSWYNKNMFKGLSGKYSRSFSATREGPWLFKALKTINKMQIVHDPTLQLGLNMLTRFDNKQRIQKRLSEIF